MNVFTYGALMFPQVMYNLLKPAHKYKSEVAFLKNYTRKQVKNNSYPGLLFTEGNNLQGILYRNIEKEDLEILHHFEGDEYEKIMIQVENQQKQTIIALAYLYSNPQNLEKFEWNVEEFQKKYKDKFAQSRLSQKQ